MKPCSYLFVKHFRRYKGRQHFYSFFRLVDAFEMPRPGKDRVAAGGLRPQRDADHEPQRKEKCPSHFNLKTMGKLYITFTGWPSCMPEMGFLLYSQIEQNIISVMRDFLYALCVAAMVITVASCTPKEDPKVEVTGITLNQTSLSLEPGASFTLTATVEPGNATDKTVSWSSSNSSVASVSGGVVNALSKGTATITASAGGKTASCTITVATKTVDVTGVSLNKTELSLYEGDTFTLEATVSPSNATDKTVTWSSSNSSVAKVSNGHVTAVSEGSATITATAGSKSASCAVTVQKMAVEVNVTSIVLDYSEVRVSVGKTVHLGFKYFPENATNTAFTWSILNPDYASVDDSGNITGIAPGETNVTVTAPNGVGASAHLVVLLSGGNEEYGYEDLN